MPPPFSVMPKRFSPFDNPFNKIPGYGKRPIFNASGGQAVERPNSAGTFQQNPPNFNDIIAALNNPNRQVGGQANFDKGIAAAQPSQGLSPETQQILDTIQKQQNYAQAQGVSQAQSLAAKRGLTGSSVEQFGTQEAVGQADRAAQDARTNVLIENMKRNQALQDLQATGYFNRGNAEATTGAQLGANQANLTSDEIASLRNMDFQQQQLALQKMLGERGIQQGQANIDAQKQIAQQQAQYGLIGSLGSAFIPSLLSRGGAGGGGGLFNLFGGAAGAGGASTLTGAAYAGAGAPASTLFPGGLGAVGTGVPAAAGLSPFAAGAGLAGAGLATMAIDRKFGPQVQNFVGKRLGGSAGSAARYLTNPIGAPLNKAKDVAGKVSGAVSSVFPF